MITVLIILNIILFITTATTVVFLCRKPKPIFKSKADEQEEFEKKKEQETVKNIMNYNVNIARRANG